MARVMTSLASPLGRRHPRVMASAGVSATILASYPHYLIGILLRSLSGRFQAGFRRHGAAQIYAPKTKAACYGVAHDVCVAALLDASDRFDPTCSVFSPKLCRCLSSSCGGSIRLLRRLSGISVWVECTAAHAHGLWYMELPGVAIYWRLTLCIFTWIVATARSARRGAIVWFTRQSRLALVLALENNTPDCSMPRYNVDRLQRPSRL